MMQKMRCKRWFHVVFILCFLSVSGGMQAQNPDLDSLIQRYQEKKKELGTMRRKKKKFIRKEITPVLQKIGRLGSPESVRFLLGAFQKAGPGLAGACAAGLFADPSGRGLKGFFPLAAKKTSHVRRRAAEQLNKQRKKIKNHLSGVERELLVFYTMEKDGRSKILLVPVVGLLDTVKAAGVLVGSVDSKKTGIWKKEQRDTFLRAVVKALASMKSSAVETYVAERLSRARDPAQVYVLLLVCGREKIEGIEKRTLLRFLERGDGRIKVAAARVLLQMGDSDVLEKILQVLKRIKKLDRDLCIELFDNLAASGNPEALEYVHAVSKGASPPITTIAMGSFGLCPKSGTALSYLLEGLESPHFYVRNAAVFSLEKFRMKPMIPGLIDLLGRERNRNLRTRVLRLLISLTGQNMGWIVEDWRKWWEATENSFAFAKKQKGTKVVARDLKYFGIEVSSSHIAFLLDASISMRSGGGKGKRSKKGKRKIDVLKEELPRVISQLPDKTFINIIPFHKVFVPWKEKLFPVAGANRRKAIQFVKGITCRYGTNIYDTLVFTLKDKSVDTIYLLSDGKPVGGTYDKPADILREIRRINRVRGVVIHALCFGKENKFMKQIARENNGTYRFVKELSK